MEVHARITRRGEVQTFVGVYGDNGAPLHEEFHRQGRSERLDAALNWGVQRARTILLESEPFSAPHRPQLTLGPVITDTKVLALRRSEMTEQEVWKIKMGDANAEYTAAKLAMLTMMRSASIDRHVWDAHRVRLQQAIDRRVNLLRIHLP